MTDLVNVYFCEEGKHKLEPVFLHREVFYECAYCPHYEHQYVECDGL